MNLYGVDFTSVPSRRKPITCAHGRLIDNVLIVDSIETLCSFEAFEAFLNRSGPWVAALDFPLSQPRAWLNDLGWPIGWQEAIARFSRMTMPEFEALVRVSLQARPTGSKLYYRPTDRITRSSSPMLLHRVPVGRMFFRGAPYLLCSGVSILPMHPNGDPCRIVLEGYPALVARKFIGKASYKSDDWKNRMEIRRKNREALINAVQSAVLAEYYGFSLQLENLHPATLADEPGADLLDAVLCCIQAAWAYTRRDGHYGIPQTAAAREGWIVDPETAVIVT